MNDWVLVEAVVRLALGIFVDTGILILVLMLCFKSFTPLQYYHLRNRLMILSIALMVYIIVSVDLHRLVTTLIIAFYTWVCHQKYANH